MQAISVSLPTWSANVGYEEGEEWVLSKMKTGYPRYFEHLIRNLSVTDSLGRFFIHNTIQNFADAIVHRYGRPGEKAILFPSRAVSQRCVDFIRRQAPELNREKVRIVELVPRDEHTYFQEPGVVVPKIYAVMFPGEHFGIAKSFWQHSGDGTSSRRAMYCHQLLDEGLLVEKTEAESASLFSKGPRRYRNSMSGRPTSPTSSSLPQQSTESISTEESQGEDQYVEERFGRNLNSSLAAKAKLAIRRRIAGSLTADVDLKDALQLQRETSTLRQVSGFSEDDVYLFPTGMSSIFNTHQALLAAGREMKSICYGYVCY